MSKSSKTTHPADLMDQFICGNAVDVMQSITDSSIDLVVTSPPYNLKNSTGNGMKNGSLNCGQVCNLMLRCDAPWAWYQEEPERCFYMELMPMTGSGGMSQSAIPTLEKGY